MNTPSHLIINLAILRRGQAPEATWPILLGAFAPDAALFGFYAWAKLVQRLPEAVIWTEAYYRQPWQDIFAVGNSIPLALAGLGGSVALHQPLAAAFFASMLLHHLCDLPLHHDDAHRHFWPLSDWRFISPVSYWDANHWGAVGALVELVILLGAVVVLWPRVGGIGGKVLLALVAAAQLTFYTLAYGWVRSS